VLVLAFCYFCFLEKLHRKYSQNWMKWKPKFLFTWHEDRVQRRDGGEPGGGRTMGWRGLPPGHAGLWCGPLGPLWHRPSSYKFPLLWKPYPPKHLSTKHIASRRSCRPEIGRFQKLFPAPCRRGAGNHHQRPSSSPCLPPEWYVSSPPMDHGSIAVARWLSSPPCASCLDLVSCLSWSRSSLCNSTSASSCERLVVRRED
jgi:hypothetical protein